MHLSSARRPRRFGRRWSRASSRGLILFGVDPLRDFPDTAAWEAAITAADFVVCFSMHENATSAKADVLFPLETHAEKDGTVTHPDGRLQRVRPSAGRPGDIRPNIQVLADLSTALGQDTGIDSQPSAFAALTGAVPFYAGITRRRHRRPRRPLAGHARSAASAARSRRRRPGSDRCGRSASIPRTVIRPGGARARHLSRPLGRPDHRAQPASEVPRRPSSAWRSPRPTPSAST